MYQGGVVAKSFGSRPSYNAELSTHCEWNSTVFFVFVDIPDDLAFPDSSIIPNEQLSGFRLLCT